MWEREAEVLPQNKITLKNFGNLALNECREGLLFALSVILKRLVYLVLTTIKLT